MYQFAQKANWYIFLMLIAWSKMLKNKNMFYNMFLCVLTP